MNQQQQTFGYKNKNSTSLQLHQDQQQQINAILQQTQITDTKYIDNQISHLISPNNQNRQKKSSVRNSFQSQFSAATQSDENNYGVRDLSLGSQCNHRVLSQKQSQDEDEEVRQFDSYDNEENDFIGKSNFLNKQEDITSTFLKKYFNQKKNVKKDNDKPYVQKFKTIKSKSNFPYKNLYLERQQLQSFCSLQQTSKKYPQFVISKPTYKIPQTVSSRQYKFQHSILEKNIQVIDIKQDRYGQKLFIMAIGTKSNKIMIQSIISNQKNNNKNKPPSSLPHFQLIQVFSQQKGPINQQPLKITCVKWSNDMKYLSISNNKNQIKVLQFRQNIQIQSEIQLKWLNVPIEIFILQNPKIKSNIVKCYFIQQNPIKLMLVDEEFQVYFIEMKKHYISMKPHITKLPIKFNEFFHIKMQKCYDQYGKSGIVLITGGQDYVTIAIIEPKFEIILVYDKQKHFPNCNYTGFPNIEIINRQTSIKNQQSLQILIGWDKYVQVLALKIQQFQPLTYKIHTFLKYSFQDSSILIGSLSDSVLYQFTKTDLKLYSLNELNKYNNNEHVYSNSSKTQISQISQNYQQLKTAKYALPFFSTQIRYKEFPQGQQIQQGILNITIWLNILRMLQNSISIENHTIFICFQNKVSWFSVESFPKYIQNMIQNVHDWKVGLQMLNDGIVGTITSFDNMKGNMLRKQLREYSSRYIQFLKSVIPLNQSSSNLNHKTYSHNNMQLSNQQGTSSQINMQTWKQQIFFLVALLIQSNQQLFLLKQILLKLYRVSPQLLKSYEPFIYCQKINRIQIQTLDLLFSIIDRKMSRKLIYSIQCFDNNGGHFNHEDDHELAHLMNNVLIRYEMYEEIIWINQFFSDYYTPFVVLISGYEKKYSIKQTEYLIQAQNQYLQLIKQKKQERNAIKHQSQHKTLQQHLNAYLLSFRQKKSQYVKLISFLFYDTLRLISTAQYGKFMGINANQKKFHITRIKAKYLIQTLIPLMYLKINPILIVNSPDDYFDYIMEEMFNGNCLDILQQLGQLQRHSQYHHENDSQIQKNLKQQIIENISFRLVLQSKSQHKYWLFLMRLMMNKIISNKIKIVPGIYYLTLQYSNQSQGLVKMVDTFAKQCYEQLNTQLYEMDTQKKNQLFDKLKNSNYMHLLKILGRQLNKQVQVLQSLIKSPKFHTIQLIQYIIELLQTPYLQQGQNMEAQSYPSVSLIKQILKKHVKLFTSIAPQKISHLLISYYKPEIKQFIYYLDSYPKQQLNLLKQILIHYNYVQFLNKQKIKYLQLLAINGEKERILQQIKQHMFPLDQAIDICKKYQILQAWAFLLVKSGGAGNAALAIDLYFQIIKDELIQTYKYNRKTQQRFQQLKQAMLSQLQKCITICIQLDLKDNHYQKQWFLIIEHMQTLKQYLYKSCSPEVEESIKQIINGFMYQELIRWLLDEVTPENLVDYLNKSINQLELQAVQLIITQMVKSFYSQKRILKNAQSQIAMLEIHQRSQLFKFITQGFLTYNRCYQCMRKDINTKIHYSCGHDIHPGCNQDLKQCISCKDLIPSLIMKQINSKQKIQKQIYYNALDSNQLKTQKQRINQTRQQKMFHYDNVLQRHNWVSIEVDNYLLNK